MGFALGLLSLIVLGSLITARGYKTILFFLLFSLSGLALYGSGAFEAVVKALPVVVCSVR